MVHNCVKVTGIELFPLKTQRQEKQGKREGKAALLSVLVCGVYHASVYE